MKKIDLDKAFSRIANLAIIAGIVFLAVELRQNNEMLAAQAQYERYALMVSANARFIENPDLVRITVKAMNQEPLTPEEAFVVDRFNNWSLQDRSFLYKEYTENRLEASDLPAELGVYVRNPLMEEYWNSRRDSLDPNFVEWVEEGVAGPE
jgi:hypothetical protein